MTSMAPPFMNLLAVIAGLRAAVAAWGGRRWLEEALVHLVHRRLGQILRRMEGMAARFQAGNLPPAGVRDAAVPDRVKAARPRRKAGVRLWPGRFGWLVQAAAWEAAGFGSQLRAALETPEMVALLTACPQAVRVLRPLCRMLAIETSVLRPGAAPGAEAVRRAVRVRTVRVAPDSGRALLPQGMMGTFCRRAPTRA